MQLTRLRVSLRHRAHRRRLLQEHCCDRRVPNLNARSGGGGEGPVEHVRLVHEWARTTGRRVRLGRIGPTGVREVPGHSVAAEHVSQQGWAHARCGVRTGRRPERRACGRPQVLRTLGMSVSSDR
jgi:hypothetical protein